MSVSPWKMLFTFFVPGGMLAGLAVWLIHFADLPPRARDFLPFFPIIVYTFAFLLGWRFNRTRLFFALLVLVGTDYLLHLFPAGELGRLTWAAAALLLPLNLAFIAWYGERGLWTPVGMLRLGAILAPPALIAGLYRLEGIEPTPWLEATLLAGVPLIERLSLPQPGLGAMALALLMVLVRYLMRPTVVEGSFCWALLLACYPLVAGERGLELDLYLASSALVLGAGFLESSYRMAFRDELTGLPARRALTEALLKLGRRYTVAMVDIDHFKKINDRYGHDVGDQVLKMVAGRLNRVTGGGRPFRYGGEEFAVLFPGKGVKTTEIHLELLREAIAEAQFVLRAPDRPRRKPEGGKPERVGARTLSVTVSIGAAERQGELTLPDQVVKAADQALYRAKKGGRNRLCC